jgi:hypothetical protein
LNPAVINYGDYTTLCIRASVDIHKQATFSGGGNIVLFGDYSTNHLRPSAILEVGLAPYYYVHIRSSGPGTVSPYGEYLINESSVISSTASPSDGKYFWFWIINNTRLEYYSPLTTVTLDVNHDYNVTAFFDDVAFTSKKTCPITIEADVNMDGKVDLTDVLYVAIRYGKTSSLPGWNVSPCPAKALDTLLIQNNAIDLSDYLEVVIRYGKTILPW